MFDPEGEVAFIDEARSVLAGRTVLVITHRPASLALADRVMRMVPGAIVEVASMPEVNVAPAGLGVRRRGLL